MFINTHNLHLVSGIKYKSVKVPKGVIRSHKPEDKRTNNYKFEFEFFVLNATFSNISAISWRPVLVVKEDGVPGENNRSWASNW